ncbi:hypothetical protein B0J12DRAFT_707015 [Macrophomina phaseolina]|uniref:Beta-ketoacyl synthase n=1 Tax=Macrophomina phaseolina TaxID=35725 RepID=A0ABQ8GZ26_9PEZI|nr:hypothetical protein B0J12DRAFT_707015 [Macrophomina phaseolina]
MDTPSGSTDVVNDHKMNVVCFGNEFPVDDVQQNLRRLHLQSKERGHSALASFLEEATSALETEVRSLQKAAAPSVPPFETIADLGNYPELRSGPIEGVLLIVIQIGNYIRHQEEKGPVTSYPAPLNSLLTARGTGLLTAAAVALAPDHFQLAFVGAEAVRIAFRFGIHVCRISENLEAGRQDASPESWAYVLTGLDEEVVQQELDKQNAKMSSPEPSKVFISAVDAKSVTISGPPTRLKNLVISSELLRYSKWAPLPVYSGLCHAPHIYVPEDASTIVGGISNMRVSEALIPLLSSETGRTLQAASSGDLFEKVVYELLTGVIRPERSTCGVVEYAAANGASDITLSTLGRPQAVEDIVTALESEIKPCTVSVVDMLPDGYHDPASHAPRNTMQSKIAIVPSAFWDLLDKGLDAHRRIPPDRFDVDSHYDPTGKRTNTSKTPFGCFIDEPGLFDAGFFNMSPREAEQTDPMHRLALVTAHEALEQAGFVPNRTRSTDLRRVGVFYGQASDDYREVNTGQEIGTYFIPGGCRAFAPGRINYVYKFAGPSFSCDTACSSSLATVQLACTSIWSGDADMIVAGGLNVLTNSDAFAGLCNGHFLSTTGSCKTWDETADGYCRADGVGSIVLKRLEDAEADNDNILGVILSAATNQSAEAVSITHPHAGAQSYLYEKVMSRAGISPLDVSYVEFHGTGTQAGDVTEMESVANVFAPATNRRRRDQPLHIGSVKANVGHGGAAAGIIALVKAVLMFKYESIPKHVGIKTGINPGLRPFLEGMRNIHIPSENTPWPRTNGRKRYSVVNNFSAAGGNTTVVSSRDERQQHAITISAKSKASLRGNVEKMLTFLEENPDVNLGDLSYTTCARRVHYNHRISLTASNVVQLKKKLASYAGSAAEIRPVTACPPPLAFVFTGQGAFYAPMGTELFRDAPEYRSEILRLDALCQKFRFPSIIPVIHEAQSSCPAIVTHLAITCVEIALARYWMSLGVSPSVVVGCSLGEYAALHIAGVLSASDTIFLVGKRAQELERYCKSGSQVMLAVKASAVDVQEVLGSTDYELACINSPNDVVVDGSQSVINNARSILEQKGYKCHQLDVPYAFHSAQMEPLLDPFEAIASTASFKAPSVPVISPLLGEVVFDAKTINSNYLRRATREPVDFVRGLDAARELGIVDDRTVWVDIGPQPVCCGFVRSCAPSTKAAVGSLRRGQDNWSTLSESLSVLHSEGVEINWNEFHRPFERGLRLLDLPSYAWNERNYWIQYKGDWALTKGNTVWSTSGGSGAEPRPQLRTSTVHEVLDESISSEKGAITVQSNVMDPDFLEAANGHRMNDCGVVTSSVHADIAFTIAGHLFKKMHSTEEVVHMNISNLVVLQGLIARKFTRQDQLIRIEACADSGSATLRWYHVQNGQRADEYFASASVLYGNPEAWMSEWSRVAHLVNGRIQDLERMANEGSANRLSKNMAYRLFQNLVDYAPKYRGMQSVILNGYEAVAEVILTAETSGVWTVPPYFIDSVAHLAGFIMNGSDASETRDFFFVTPGWQSMRFARPLRPGGRYRSYVKMSPANEPGFWSGDVLLSTLFSPPDVDQAGANPPSAIRSEAANAPQVSRDATEPMGGHARTKAPSGQPSKTPSDLSSQHHGKSLQAGEPTEDAKNPTVSGALRLIAEETSLDIAQLTDDATFVSLGVGSLMSLVLSEKFRSKLGIEVKSSLFMECPSIGELKNWLEQYC